MVIDLQGVSHGSSPNLGLSDPDNIRMIVKFPGERVYPPVDSPRGGWVGLPLSYPHILPLLPPINRYGKYSFSGPKRVYMYIFIRIWKCKSKD